MVIFFDELDCWRGSCGGGAWAVAAGVGVTQPMGQKLIHGLQAGVVQYVARSKVGVRCGAEGLPRAYCGTGLRVLSRSIKA